jgi:uncharacterized alkaline shock family protein YloU
MPDEGKIEVSPRAVAIIAAAAVSECYGVVGMVPRTFGEALLSALHRPPTTKGISVRLDDDTIVVDVFVVIEYGTRVITVADNITSAVRFNLERALGTSSLQVNVFVHNVRVGTPS